MAAPIAAALVAAALSGAAGCAVFDRERDEAHEAPEGAALYRSYCAACHGIEGRGDGPVAEVLDPPPGDLTTIAASEGWFPSALVQMIVDGRYAPHGGRAMPVWGRKLTVEELRAVTDHLERLQE